MIKRQLAQDNPSINMYADMLTALDVRVAHFQAVGAAELARTKPLNAPDLTFEHNILQADAAQLVPRLQAWRMLD